MAKRKPAVNDIIYELDNDDSELSSDDEVREPKIIRYEENNSPNTIQSDTNTIGSGIEVIDVDSSLDTIEKVDGILSPEAIRNGGKTPDSFIVIDEASDTASPKTPSTGADRGKKLNSDTIFHEDIIIDSPASNSDPGVVGCENRTPLLTVRFRDTKLAMNYKKKIKAFMLNLIKLHENELDLTESDNDTDLELDIWPEDLAENDFVKESENPADNLFFIDTDPCQNIKPMDVPSYSQNASLISNISEKEPSPPPMFRRKGPTCFNCNGSHTMRECTLPRNNLKIAENRKAMVRLGRYHVEDEQKYGHLVPGRISGQLRHALGLKRHELPIHVYRMRQMGYPPGWLEEARISHSGITLFDSSGQATLDPEEEEGEVYEPGSKDKFDIKKILDIPGFNVPASSRYKEEAHKLGLPPMSEQDSKMAMLQVLAPNAMKAYKRKKLTFFPSAPGQAPMEGQAEMDIDSGDEVVDFPSQPPLPDDAPPPPPPPPDTPPPPDSPPSLPRTVQPKISLYTKINREPSKYSIKEERKSSDKSKESAVDKSKDQKTIEHKTGSDDDIEVVDVMEVADIPVPYADMITIDVDGDVSETETGRTSPSLDDLERKKSLLLNALDTEKEEIDTTQSTVDAIPETKNDHTNADIVENNGNENHVYVDKTATADVNMEEQTEESIQIAEIQKEHTADDQAESSNQNVKVKVVALNTSDKDEPLSLDDTETVEIVSIEDTDTIDPISVDSTDNVEGRLPVDTDNLTPSLLEDTDKTKSLDSIDKVEQRSMDSAGITQSSQDKTDKAEPNSMDTSEIESSSINIPKVDEAINSIDSDDLTTTSKLNMGHVRVTEYGTPVINVASPYLKLPSDDKFAKDICDVINFENLPNSTGKYKKISTLLKKVKSEVDRIQES